MTNSMDVTYLPPEVLQDLNRSTISASFAELAGIMSHEESGLKGYTIPYYDPFGRIIPGMFRIKILNSAPDAPKYIQPVGSTSHLYIPPMRIYEHGLYKSAWVGDLLGKVPEPLYEGLFQYNKIPLIITEGEKKTLAAIQLGFPTIGIGGVDNWRSNTLEITKEQRKLLLEMPDDKDRFYIPRKTDIYSQSGVSMGDVVPELGAINLIGRDVFIVFDNDPVAKFNAKARVSEAAFELGLWLETQGANCYYVVLPSDSVTKIGLDDYLFMSIYEVGIENTKKEFIRLLEEARSSVSFPQIPHIRRWIDSKLNQKTKNEMARQRYDMVAAAVISDMDHRGYRFRDTNNTHYLFFDKDEGRLYSIDPSGKAITDIHRTSFGQEAYRRYGISQGDAEVIKRIVARWGAKEPIGIVDLHKVMYSTFNERSKEGAFYYSIDSSKIVKITADSVELVTNGTDNIFFLEQDFTEFEAVHFTNIAEYLDDLPAYNNKEEIIQTPLKNLWYNILETTTLQALPSMTRAETIALVATMFYISPWLYKWGGLSIPVELVTGEPNSGKTHLYQARQSHITGHRGLDTFPISIRDWNAKIESAAGLWVCDNVSEQVDPTLLDTMRETISYIVTDPKPVISVRTLYTTAEIHKIPVRTPPVFTSVQPLFTQEDFLQRSIWLRFDKIPEDRMVSNWAQSIAERRPEFLASQFRALQAFFLLVRTEFDQKAKSKHRLQYFEQAISLMSLVFGEEFHKNAVNGVQKLSTSLNIAYASSSDVLALFDQYIKDNKDTVKFTVQDLLDYVRAYYLDDVRNISEFKTPAHLHRWAIRSSNIIEQTRGFKVVPGEYVKNTFFELMENK